MNQRIVVRQIMEWHDCTGKKFIDVTTMGPDELICSRFRLTSVFMLPQEKLRLSCIAPMDEVGVVVSDYTPHPLVVGEVVTTFMNVDDRVAVCRCGASLISDGNDIFCPNKDCGLTLFARLQRLASTTFLSYYDHNEEYGGFFSEEPASTNPFSIILQPKMWGEAIHPVEEMLLYHKHGHVSLATFLIAPLFTSFLDSIQSPLSYNDVALQGVGDFFGRMEELIQRRDYSLPWQDRLLKSFIWSLGIESLNEDVIDRMILFEKNMGLLAEVMVSYRHLLANPNELIRELRVHPLEAHAINREFHNRRYEFEDIFKHYTRVDDFTNISLQMT